MMSADSSHNYLLLLVEPFWQIFGAIMLSVLPVWGLAARLRLDPLTKLLVAVMGSYTLMYLLEFGSYLFSVPKWLPLSLLLIASLASSIYANLKWRKSPGTTSFPWDGILAWGGLAVWIMGMQSRIVVYSTSHWFGDWYEHYERAIFFLNQLPPDTKFLRDLWLLPARGPIFNASAALLMSIFGRDFWVYQTMATVLNTFPVLPMALLIRDMARMRQVSALLWSSLLLGIAPFAVQHETFTWTRFFAVGLILGGIHLYRFGSIQNRPWLVGLSLGAFASGILAHYMALTFALFFIAHFFYSVIRKSWGWQAVIYPTAVCSALLATWFVYLIVTFGFKATLTENSTLGDKYVRLFAKWSGSESLEWYQVLTGNMISTIVPYSWRHGITGIGHAPRILQMDTRAGPRFTPSPSEMNPKTEWLADLANNPTSLLGSLGWAGGIGIMISAVLWIQERRKGQRSPQMDSPLDLCAPAPEPGWRFWLIFFVLGIPLNMLLSRTYIPAGLVHVNLQPFVFLTALFLLRWLRDLPLFAKVFLCGIFLVESALTTGALIALQQRPLPLVLRPDGAISIQGKLGLDPVYVDNYMYKLTENAVFLSDKLGDLAGPFSLIGAVAAIGLLITALIWSSLSKTKEEQ